MSTPNVCEMMRAIRGQPNRGLRDLSSTMAWMSASLGPFGPGFLRARARREQSAVLATHQRLMKRQERRGAEGDGDLSDSSWTEEERPESAQQPVAQRQVRRPLATTTKNDQLLLEHEILRDHRSHATGATQLRGHDGEVQQGEQEVLHARVSVGQTPGATQRCPIRNQRENWQFETHRFGSSVALPGEIAYLVERQRNDEPRSERRCGLGAVLPAQPR